MTKLDDDLEEVVAGLSERTGARDEELVRDLQEAQRFLDEIAPFLSPSESGIDLAEKKIAEHLASLRTPIDFDLAASSAQMHLDSVSSDLNRAEVTLLAAQTSDTAASSEALKVVREGEAVAKTYFQKQDKLLKELKREKRRIYRGHLYRLAPAVSRVVLLFILVALVPTFFEEVGPGTWLFRLALCAAFFLADEFVISRLVERFFLSLRIELVKSEVIRIRNFHVKRAKSAALRRADFKPK